VDLAQCLSYIKSIVVDYIGNTNVAITLLIMWATHVIPLKLYGLSRHFVGRAQVVPLAALCLTPFHLFVWLDDPHLLLPSCARAHK
jgi:hypothetical protein